MAEKVLSPEFRLSYCKLATPDKKEGKNGEMNVYSITMIFDPSVQSTPEFKAMEAMVEDLKKEKWGNKQPSYIRSPFRKGVAKSEQNPNGFNLTKNPEYEGKIIVTAKSYGKRPGAVYPDTTPIFAEDLQEVLYSGCYARAFLTVFAYGPSLGGPSGQSDGISFGLSSIQKLKDGEPLAGGFDDGSDFTAFQAPVKEGNHEDLLNEV